MWAAVVPHKAPDSSIYSWMSSNMQLGGSFNQIRRREHMSTLTVIL